MRIAVTHNEIESNNDGLRDTFRVVGVEYILMPKDLMVGNIGLDLDSIDIEYTYEVKHGI